jgi:hypothetical protein
MVVITADPQNPEKLILSATVTLFIDRLLVETLSDELEAQIRSQAIKDLKRNKEVQKAVAEAATKKLLQMLGVTESAS